MDSGKKIEECAVGMARKIDTLRGEFSPAQQLRSQEKQAEYEGRDNPPEVSCFIAPLQRSLRCFNRETTRHDDAGTQEKHPRHGYRTSICID